MNLPIAPITPTFSAHMMLETRADGQVAVWVAELPDCRVVAESRERAIAALEPLFNERMTKIEVMPLSLPTSMIESSEPHPLDNFPFIDKNDPDFIAFMAEMRATRELDDDNPAYTINW